MKSVIESKSLRSDVVLFALRFSPLMPINSISSVYGTTDMPYIRYVLVSLAGFSFKIFSYTIIGRNVYDPASASFIVPFIILFVITGFVLLSLGAAQKNIKF